jgi:hypothetical protein
VTKSRQRTNAIADDFYENGIERESSGEGASASRLALDHMDADREFHVARVGAHAPADEEPMIQLFLRRAPRRSRPCLA